MLLVRGSVPLFVRWELDVNYNMADLRFSDLALLVLKKEVLKRLDLVSVRDRVHPEDQNRRKHRKYDENNLSCFSNISKKTCKLRLAGSRSSSTRPSD